MKAMLVIVRPRVSLSIQRRVFWRVPNKEQQGRTEGSFSIHAQSIMLLLVVRVKGT